MVFGASLAFLLALRALSCQQHGRNASDIGRISWTGAQFRFECHTVDTLLRDEGRYIPRNNIALRGQISGNDLYLAYPRLRSGVPATVATTCLLTDRTCEALMTPYPCLSVQEQGKPGEVQNAVDLYLDAQDVLWVLDTGVVQTLDTEGAGPQRTGPPTVWAFDLCTQKLVKKIDLSCLTTPMSRLQYMVVDRDPGAVDGECHVYVSDAANRALIVYDVAGSKGVRVLLPKAIAAGCAKRDVLYVALARAPCGASALIVTYLSGGRAFTVRTEYLRKGSAGKMSDLGVKPDKMVILGADGGTAVFFRYDASPEVYRWDAATPFAAENFVPVYRSGPCFLATQVMADRARNRLMVLETNFSDFTHNTVGCGIVHNVRVLEGCF